MAIAAAKKPAKKASTKTATAAVKKPVEIKGAIYGYEDKVDRLTELQKTFAKIPGLTDLLKEKTAIEKQLREAADEKIAAEETGSFVGAKKLFVVDPKSMERSIVSMNEIRIQLGDELFMQLVSMSMKDIDKYLSAEQKKNCLAETRTGSRKGKLVDKE